MAAFDPIEAKKELHAMWEQLIASGKIRRFEVHKLHLNLVHWYDQELLVQQELTIILRELGLEAGRMPEMRGLPLLDKPKTTQ